MVRSCGLFAADKVLVTPPLNGLILPGVVRHSVLELTRQWNEFHVEERTITMDEVVALHKRERVSYSSWLCLYITLLTVSVARSVWNGHCRYHQSS